MATDGHLATTRTAEGYFANLKRQVIGTHHHTSHKHLPRYLEEHDHKYNTRDMSDVERTEAAIANIEGRRLSLYKSTIGKGESLFRQKAGDPAPLVVGEEPRREEVTPRPKRAKRKSGSTAAKRVPRGCSGQPDCVCSDCEARRFYESEK